MHTDSSTPLRSSRLLVILLSLAAIGPFLVFGFLYVLGGMALRSALTTSFFMGVLLLVGLFAGIGMRTRVGRRALLQKQYEQAELERDRQLAVAAATERSRIAREMHDIVAHSLSVVIAQADGGRYAGAQNPDLALASLDQIAETGRSALTDMRRLLGVLRDDSPAGDPAQLRDPQPSIINITDLVENMRAAGLPVSYVSVGTSTRLPSGVGLVAYRICQEALTNSLKHGGPGVKATLVVTWRPSSLTISASDDGRGASSLSDGMGNGVIGMRERVQLFGGTLTAGPRPGGGYRVEAVLPILQEQL